MKNIMAFILLFLSPSLFAQEGTFTVSGNLPGLATDTMYLDFPGGNNGRLTLKVPVSNNSFHFTGKINGIQMVRIWPNVKGTVKSVGNGYFPAKSSQFQFVGYPGANVKFTGKITDYVDAYPSGDAANDALARLNKAVYPLMNESVNLQLKIAKKEFSDSSEIKAAQKKSDALDEKVKEAKKKFIIDNPSSYVAAWLLGDMMMRTELTKEESFVLYDKLNHQKLNTNPFFIEVVKRVEGLRATAVGKPAPEIVSVHTYDKKKFDLASLKGKYVVLDFWGTWCGPCISGMPKMKEYLDKYKSKMEIVGIAQESDDGSGWRRFLDKNTGYHWHQVLSRPDDDFILKYSVAGFPTKIIVDPKGDIVARFVGEDEGIYNKLDELLK